MGASFTVAAGCVPRLLRICNGRVRSSHAATFALASARLVSWQGAALTAPLPMSTMPSMNPSRSAAPASIHVVSRIMALISPRGLRQRWL